MVCKLFVNSDEGEHFEVVVGLRKQYDKCFNVLIIKQCLGINGDAVAHSLPLLD